MNDQKKSKVQLIEELTVLRQRVAALERAEVERKQAEEFLQENERLLTDIAANYPNSYLSIIEKDLTIGFTSGQEFKKQNLDPQGFVGLSLEQVFGEHTPIVREHYLKTFQGEETSFELFINNQHQLYKVTPLYDQHGQITRILAVVENITERKRAEELLRQEKERAQMYLDITPAIIMALDTNGCVSLINEQGCRILECDRDEIIGKNWFDTFLPERAKLQVRSVFNQLLTGDVKPVEYIENAVLTGKGNERIVRWHNTVLKDETGRVIGTLAAAEDITQRKRAEEELQQSNDLLRAIIEAAPTAIIGLDLDGNVQMVWNPAAEKMLGWNAQEAMGHPLPSVPVENQEEFRRFRERIRSGLTLDGVEVHRQRRDGSPIDYSIYASPLHDAEGQISGNIAVLVEITERKRAEEQIKASLREKEVLLQEVHHRVKNNLQVISSLLDMQADTIDDPRLLQAFQDSQQRVRSMALVHEKLYQSTDLAHIDFADYVQEMVDYLFMLYSHQTGPIIPRLAVEEVFLGVDQAIPCGLIINELVSNALKHAFPPPLTSLPVRGIEGGQSPAGGTGGKQPFPTPEIRVAFAAQDGECVLVVGDNGVGLPPELDIETSSSLGLQLVNILVRQLQGSLEIDRRQGATFTLTFPEH